jgi:hypothetical protein
MPADIKSIIQNTKDIYMSDSSLNTLLDLERIIDELDVYAFDNWKMGELVEGPVYEKYFVSATFMWPYKKMPDPRGGERLLEYDCVVKYRKDHLKYPVKVKNPSDFEPGTKMPKMGKAPIWLVEITVPKKLMRDINKGSLELEAETIEVDEIDQSYDEGTGGENADVPPVAAAPVDQQQPGVQ